MSLATFRKVRFIGLFKEKVNSYRHYTLHSAPRGTVWENVTDEKHNRDVFSFVELSAPKKNPHMYDDMVSKEFQMVLVVLQCKT